MRPKKKVISNDGYQSSFDIYICTKSFRKNIIFIYQFTYIDIMAETEEKRKKHPEIYILLFFGLEANDIIKIGYSKNTVYKYMGEMTELKANIKKLLIK